MKILIDRINWQGGRRSFINFSLILPSSRLTTNALIDTGSPYTVITEPTLKRTRIPYTKYDYFGTIVIGKIILNLVELGKGTIVFKDEKNILHPFEHDIYGGIFVDRNVEIIGTFPNIFGEDFRDKNEISIVKEQGKDYFMKLNLDSIKQKETE